MQRITSRQNPLVARYRAVARGDVGDLLLLDGVHLVSEALAARIAVRHAVVGPDADARVEVGVLVSRLQQTGVEIVTASSSVMDVLSPVRSSSPIVAIAERPAHELAALHHSDRTLVVIASGIQDPGNLGALMRVAEAGGATGVITTDGSAEPFGWKALRGSMGSALRLPIIAGLETGAVLADARRHGWRIVATTPRGGLSPFDIDLTGPTAVLIGGEGSGLAQALVDAADERVTIPMQAPVESLNAAVTTALIVYEARRQRAATANAARRTQRVERRT